MNLKSTLGRNCHDPHRNFEIDLALAVVCCLIGPGQRLSSRTIGQITGMGHAGAYAIEQRALKKLRLRLKYTVNRQLGEELVA